jgi:hypothetical protein
VIGGLWIGADSTVYQAPNSEFRAGFGLLLPFFSHRELILIE